MLKDKRVNLEVGSVYAFRSNLIGEVVGKVESVSDEHVFISHPHQLAQLDNGKVGFVPAFPLAKSSIPISVPLADLIHYQVNDDVETGYNTATTGIVVPKKQGIITS
jgi:hypothetical protein